MANSSMLVLPTRCVQRTVSIDPAKIVAALASQRINIAAHYYLPIRLHRQ